MIPKLREKIVVTNGNQSDQVTASFIAGTLKGWSLCRPRDPVADKAKQRERLHAKFLFLGKASSGKLSDGWLYLGSGNLSKRGFLLDPAKGGNIEAGVLLSVPELDSLAKLARALPIGSEFKSREFDEFEFQDEELSPDAPELPPAPVLVFQALPNGNYSIVWDPDVNSFGPVSVVMPDGTLQVLTQGQSSLTGTGLQTLRFLELRWENHSCKVPCLNGLGEFKRQPIQVSSFDSWLDQLTGLSDAWHDPAGDEDEDELLDGESPGPGLYSRVDSFQLDRRTGGRDFPAHTAMKLVEALAERNGTIPEEQAADWLKALRLMLLENKPEPLIQGWRTLGVNFLGALLSPRGFAPPWNNLGASCTRQLIEEIAEPRGIDQNERLDP